jgi:hypothetical protein
VSWRRFSVGLVGAGVCAACGSADPTGSGGEGTVSVTTWGEDYIEQEIPVDPGDGSGFVDGWSVSYERFLVNFQNVRVADSDGESAASFDGAYLVDNTKPGVKTLTSFEGVPARAWDTVSYEIAPVTASSGLATGVSEADRTLMADGGYGIYVAGTATKGDVQKHFAWGFAIGTAYDECHSEQDGKAEAGIVVTNNAELDLQLTTHGDHFFYDRLQSSPDPSIETSLRFDALAAADADDDGEITLDELNATLIDVTLYDPSGLGASTYGAFVTALARTVGHFRGEGECTVRKL